MTLKPIELPYGHAALEPHVSRETMAYHYGKHYLGYVRKLADAVAGTEYAGSNLTEIVCQAPDTPFFDDAAQAWNHEFYFHCMTPESTKTVRGVLAAAIARDFGSFDAMCEASCGDTLNQ